MRRRSRSLLVPVVVLAAGLTACSDDDAAPTTSGSTPATATAPTPATSAPPSVATTTPPSLTTPASVIADTAAVGGSSLSSVDLATGATTALGTVGTEVGVLGIAAGPGGAVDAVTDAPALLVLDTDDLAEPGAETPVDAAGSTLLALARRPADGALFAIGDTGVVVALDPATGGTTPVAEVALADPGVGLDVAADGALEVIVATGERVSVDLDSGAVTDLPMPAGDAAAPPRIVAIAHDGRGRYGIDAASDTLVAIADDGAVTTIGPLGLDVTDGASLDIDASGRALLANPG